MSNIKYWREKRGLTQADLATKSDLSRATIINYETEKRSPKACDLERIATALNVSVEELLNGPSEDTREIKLILDKEGEFSMQMFNVVNMSANGADQRLVCVSKDKITTGFSLTTAGLDKETAQRMFMDEVAKAFENAWSQQEKWREEHSPIQKA